MSLFMEVDTQAQRVGISCPNSQVPESLIQEDSVWESHRFVFLVVWLIQQRSGMLA